MQTPLHLSLEVRAPELARILVGHGADPGVANSLGETGYHLAVKSMSEVCLSAVLAGEVAWVSTDRGFDRYDHQGEGGSFSFSSGGGRFDF